MTLTRLKFIKYNLAVKGLIRICLVFVIHVACDLNNFVYYNIICDLLNYIVIIA